LNLNQLNDTRESAKETVGSLDRRHSLSTSGFERLQTFLLEDSFAFAQIVCGHEDLVPELHMPLSYVVCGLTDRLIATLDAPNFNSYVTKQIRRELWSRSIDWRTPDGRAALDRLLDFVNIRWFRGSYKSSTGTHAGTTFLATRDPNITAKITHAADDKAWEFCSQIGATIQSGVFHDLFPHRVPKMPHRDITEGRIDLAGRTVSRPQGTIQAGGYMTKDIGGHYDLFMIDDLVMERNATPEMLKGVHTWLRNLEGYYIEAPGVRVRRVHLGTKWDEDDDDAFLTRGANARNCLTVRVPIEEHEGEVVNLLDVGRPTIPQLYSAEKIAAKKARVINGLDGDATDRDGAKSWRCNYLLDAYAGDALLFPPSLVDDPVRAWRGPFEHPKAKSDPSYAKRFLVSRFARDERGRIVDKNGKAIDTNVEGWSKGAKRLYFDPWQDLDIVMTLDPAWVRGGDNWALTVAGVDYEGVKFQLETRSEDSGMSGWIEALAELDDAYLPRVVGFDRGGYQDPVIQNLLKTNPRMRRLRGRAIGIPHNGMAKKARIRAGVAEPMRMFKWLLAPLASVDQSYDFGAQATRDELKKYRGDKYAVDGIADSMAMVDAVCIRRESPQDEAEARRVSLEREAANRRRVHPALGVPLVA
jgi:hypothetical protein